MHKHTFFSIRVYKNIICIYIQKEEILTDITAVNLPAHAHESIAPGLWINSDVARCHERVQSILNDRITIAVSGENAVTSVKIQNI